MSLRSRQASRDAYAFADRSVPVRLVTSKDSLRTVAVRMDDALFNLCWGRLQTNTHRGPADVLSAAAATEWVMRERSAPIPDRAVDWASPYVPAASREAA